MERIQRRIRSGIETILNLELAKPRINYIIGNNDFVELMRFIEILEQRREEGGN